MVIIDRKNLTSFQKPFKPTSKSNSLVITIPKIFTDILHIDIHTKVVLSLTSERDGLIVRKLEDGIDL